MCFIPYSESEENNTRCYHYQATAQIVEVIMTTNIEGSGTLDDPVRMVTRYFNKDGSLICKIDSCEKDNYQALLENAAQEIERMKDEIKELKEKLREEGGV